MCAALDRGMDDAKHWIQDRCKFIEELDLRKRNHFFFAPCLHFPKMETFKDYLPSGASDEDSGVGGGDGTNGDGGNGSAETTQASTVARKRPRRACVATQQLIAALEKEPALDNRDDVT